MDSLESKAKPKRAQRGTDKVSRIPVKVIPSLGALPRKPPWLKVKAPSDPKVLALKKLIRKEGLHTVCEEASCPNIGECFAHGTATFMIMGDLCTRRCPFCDVAHGRPDPLDETEPAHLANAIEMMDLRYIVITSVDRDDLRDGGASHFADCIDAVRCRIADIQIEVLVPDFRGRMDLALENLLQSPPDVFNHNLETVPRLYLKVRPGSDYRWSLELIRKFKQKKPNVPTKSGLMLGLGEEITEVQEVLRDLRERGCDRVTLGQYLQPSRAHLPVQRFVSPEEFQELKVYAEKIGFKSVASGPLVRSSYHADLQAAGLAIS
ncbi:MAG: lipoyl synthase [Proteobacteria bacterium]|nr:lipoyl synthase [Pseudomonadota bacterium]